MSNVKERVREIIRPLGLMIKDLGMDPRRVVALRHFGKYRAQYKMFSQLGGKVSHRYVVLSDYGQQAGSAMGHYFHQDLLVASLIFKKNPTRHIDIGSRVDGFVAHVAAFRKIEVMDIRDLDDIGHENVTFVKADLMESGNAQRSISDSISCLHAIEHFGLGRYGDPIDPDGHLKAFRNILQMLQPGGTLYISFPIGRSNEVHFNAHRVFHPKDILGWSGAQDGVKLRRFDYVDDSGHLHQDVNLEKSVPDVHFGCGIYTFEKI